MPQTAGSGTAIYDREADGANRRERGRGIHLQLLRRMLRRLKGVMTPNEGSGAG